MSERMRDVMLRPSAMSLILILVSLTACSPRAADPLAVQPVNTQRPQVTRQATFTARPTNTDVQFRASNTPRGVSATPGTVISSEDFTATGNANVRSCPETTCDIVAGLVLGQRVVKVGEAQGASVNGSALWYEIQLESGAVGYVHSGLLRYGTPRPAPVVVQPRPTQPSNALVAATKPAGAPTDTAVLFEPMTSTPPPAGPQSPFGCNGIDDLNCGDFRAIGQNANAHLAACGDEDNLDGDGDGRACER